MPVYEHLAILFVHVLYAYALLGALFATAFVTRGVQRIDSGARGTGIAFRLLLIPGTIAFWPLLLRRWLSGQTDPPIERNPHR